MYNKTIIRFGFCDIQNNQGLGKGYQPSALVDNHYFDLDYSGYHKTSSNNCLKSLCDLFLMLQQVFSTFVPIATAQIHVMHRARR